MPSPYGTNYNAIAACRSCGQEFSVNWDRHFEEKPDVPGETICGHDGCLKLLCECCAGRCEDCGAVRCAEHLIKTDCGLLCSKCAAEIAQEAQESDECRCRQVDADQYDARNCPSHGPHSPAARRELESEAAAEAAYWQQPGWAEVFKDTSSNDFAHQGMVDFSKSTSGQAERTLLAPGGPARTFLPSPSGLVLGRYLGDCGCAYDLRGGAVMRTTQKEIK